MKIANEAMKHWYLMKRTWEFESLPFVTLGLPVCFYQINEEIIHIHDAQRCGCNFCAHELLKKWMHDHDEEHNFETDYALYELTESDSDGDLLVVFDGQMITNI